MIRLLSGTIRIVVQSAIIGKIGPILFLIKSSSQICSVFSVRTNATVFWSGEILGYFRFPVPARPTALPGDRTT